MLVLCINKFAGLQIHESGYDSCSRIMGRGYHESNVNIINGNKC